MNFRTKVFITFLPLALLPLVTFAYLVRNEVSKRLTTQFENQVQSVTASVTSDLVAQSDAIAASLNGIGELMFSDNRFRAAIATANGNDRSYVIDFASKAMKLTGLSVLQLQDPQGRIISSGHFRGEFDRIELELPRLLSTLGSRAALASVRTPTGTQLAILRVDSAVIAGLNYKVVGGRVIGAEFLDRLSPDENLNIRIVYPGGVIGTKARPDSLALDFSPAGRTIEIPYVDQPHDSVSRAILVIDRGTAELDSLQGSMDRWLAFMGLLSIGFVMIGVSILAARISRPLTELADKTARINLDRLNVDFHTRRRDEIGHLSSVLGRLTRKLKTSASEIRDAERRAAQGELARQVNHDIKNGLTPIRNVFTHLLELANSTPADVPEVLKSRSETIESSLAYLATLSSNYAKLSPDTIAMRCDFSAIVRHVVADAEGRRSVTVEADASEIAFVLADPVSLRRIVENLVDNAIDSIEGSGTVTVSIELVSDDPAERLVRLTVADTGVGMEPEVRERVFDDFYTTKEKGTGLGLSIVRRLVMDSGGRISVESKAGRGSRFVVDLPALEVEGTPASQ
jgi:signal transduction histidine kinase